MIHIAPSIKEKQPGVISTENHILAAKHHEEAARLHLEAAKYHEEGDYIKARESSFKAHGHFCLVCEHSIEDKKHHS